MSNKLDLMSCWKDALALLQRNREMIVAIAGVFHFLPALAMGLMVPEPSAEGAKDLNAAAAVIMQFAAAHWPWLLGVTLAAMAGSLTILAGILRNGQLTVGAAIMTAFGLLPSYFLASALSGLAIAAGASLLFIPGIYLAIKFILIGPVAAAEGIRNPIALLQRSWKLTAGNSLWILLYFATVLAVGLVAMSALSLLTGVIFSLALPETAAAAARVAVDALTGTLLSLALLLSYAAIYRQLYRTQ